MISQPGLRQIFPLFKGNPLGESKLAQAGQVAPARLCFAEFVGKAIPLETA